MDIKPENIAFSPYFQKDVFLDYGFSDIIEEEVGYKTLTKFKGTLTYCSV
jgi:serine/threonine protein kinase